MPSLTIVTYPNKLSFWIFFKSFFRRRKQPFALSLSLGLAKDKNQFYIQICSFCGKDETISSDSRLRLRITSFARPAVKRTRVFIHWTVWLHFSTLRLESAICMLETALPLLHIRIRLNLKQFQLMQTPDKFNWLGESLFATKLFSIVYMVIRKYA